MCRDKDVAEYVVRASAQFIKPKHRMCFGYLACAATRMSRLVKCAASALSIKLKCRMHLSYN